MIGWENDRGAYYINKLQEQIDSLASEDESIETSIGTLTNLTTTEKSNLVGAVNEVNSSLGTTDAKIGSLSDLTTTEKTSVVGAVNEVDSDISTLTATAPFLIGAVSTTKPLMIDIETASKALIMVSGASNDSCNMYLVHSTGANAITCKALSTSSNVTVTVATGRITISSSSGSLYVSGIAFFGKITPVAET